MQQCGMVPRAPIAGIPAEVAGARCCWSKWCQRRTTAPERLLKGIMEHYLTAGLRNIDGLLTATEKRGEPGYRRQQMVVGCTELLDIPLGTKIPLLPGSNPVFYRTKLGEKLHQSSGYFTLGDPHCRLLSTEYNSLHDPHLQAYYNRKDNLRRLRRGGYITSDGKVVCTLREFNEYRQYLTMLRIEADKMFRQEQRMLHRQLAKLKDAPELPKGMDISRLREWLLREQRESLRDREREMRERFLDMIAQRMEKLVALEKEKHLLRQAERQQQHLRKKRPPGTQSNSKCEPSSQPSVAGKKNRRLPRTSVVCQEALEVVANGTSQSTSSQKKDTTQKAVKRRPKEASLCSSKLLSCQEPPHHELQGVEDNLSDLLHEDQDTKKQESSTENSSRQTFLCPKARTSLSSGVSKEDNDSDLKESQIFLQKSLNKELHNIVQAMLLWATQTEVQELEEVAESVVEEVLERVKELGPTVCMLRRAPRLIGRRFFGSTRKTESSKTSAPDLQQEIEEAASEIVANIMDSLGKHLVCYTTDASEPRLLTSCREHLITRGARQAGKTEVRRASQAELPDNDGATPLASLDQIGKDVVEKVGSTLQSFVASQFEHHFQCKFSEILELPVETISKRRLQPSWTPFSTQGTKKMEGSFRASEQQKTEATKKRKSPLQALRAFYGAAAESQESNMPVRGRIQTAISKVKQLHSELKEYAKIAVHNVLETLKRQQKKLDEEMHSSDSSEESTMASELVNSVLDQCSQTPGAPALGLNCGKQVAKQCSARDGDESSLGQDLQRLGGKKIPARKLERSPPITKLPHLSLPGMVIPSEAEAPFEEELLSKLLTSVLQNSEQGAHSPPESIQKPLHYPSAHTQRFYTPVLKKTPKLRPGSMQDTSLSIDQKFSLRPTPPPKTPTQREARHRHRRVKLMPGELEPRDSGEMVLAGQLVESVLRRCVAPCSSSSDASAED